MTKIIEQDISLVWDGSKDPDVLSFLTEPIEESGEVLVLEDLSVPALGQEPHKVDWLIEGGIFDGYYLVDVAGRNFLVSPDLVVQR